MGGGSERCPNGHLVSAEAQPLPSESSEALWRRRPYTRLSRLCRAGWRQAVLCPAQILGCFKVVREGWEVSAASLQNQALEPDVPYFHVNAISPCV